VHPLPFVIPPFFSYNLISFFGLLGWLGWSSISFVLTVKTIMINLDTCTCVLYVFVDDSNDEQAPVPIKYCVLSFITRHLADTG